MSQFIVWNLKANALVNGPHATEDDAQAALNRVVETNYHSGNLRPDLVIAEIPNA